MGTTRSKKEIVTINVDVGAIAKKAVQRWSGGAGGLSAAVEREVEHRMALTASKIARDWMKKNSPEVKRELESALKKALPALAKTLVEEMRDQYR